MIPPAFVDRYLWSSPQPHPPTVVSETSSLDKDESLPPCFEFSDGVLEELETLTALAFYEAEKPRAVDTPVADIPSEKCLVLSCPTLEGACIIDEAVRRVAATHEADVVVLDALELAMGRYGLLGTEAGRILEELYPSTVASASAYVDALSDYGGYVAGKEAETEVEKEAEKKEEAKVPSAHGERMRRLVDALLNIQPADLSSNEEVQQSHESRPARRIVYFRDFQYIVGVGRPLLAYVLRALYEMRCADDPDKATSSESVGELTSEERSATPTQPNDTAPKHTTVLVFGSTNDSEALLIGSSPMSSRQNYVFLNCLFTHARTSIIHHRSPGFLCTCHSCWGSPPSRPVAINDAQLTDAQWDSVKMDTLSSEKLAVSVFAKNIKSGTMDSAWQKRSKSEKIGRVNEALLRICLEREGISLEDEALDGALSKSSQIGSGPLLDVSDATDIVKITRGLMVRRSSSGPKASNLVSEAYGILERRQNERRDWDGGRSKAESDDKEPEKDTYEDVSDHARDLLGCIVDTDDISTTFSDVCLDENIVDSLKTIVTLPLLYPSYFSSGILAKEAIGGVLLYGPPGTGKTMLCRALAKASHAKMLHIKPSDVYNKWVGESEKTVAAVFVSSLPSLPPPRHDLIHEQELAHRIAPCIVFIDEIDSLFSRRTDCIKTWERNVLTEFMQSYLKDETLDDGVDLDTLANKTDGFSGSDLKNLCVAAAVASVKEAIGSGWRNTEKPLDPTSQESPKDSDDKSPSGSAEAAETLPARTITASNVAQALQEISRSVAEKGANELYLWHERHSGAAKSTANPAMNPANSSRVGLGGNHWNRWAKSDLAHVGTSVSVKEIH
ncbi:hypothetical protein MD484_g8039, partial [Candolleomyces efflorescens]